MKKRLISLFLCLLIFASGGLTAFAEELPTEPEDPTTPPTQAVDLKDCDITLQASELSYTGYERLPYVIVKYGDTKFKKDIDFTLNYSDNINAGSAKITITAVAGSEVLKGKIVKKFKILPKDISKIKTKTISQTEFVYNGKEKKPTVTVDGEDFHPVLDTDYTVTYKNNVKIGMATVTVKGKGNYTGSFQKNFYINPRSIQSLKVSKVKSTTFTLSWSKSAGNIDGYRIYRYNSKTGNYDYAVSTKNTYFDVAGRTPATAYTYTVKPYKKYGSKLLVGKFGATKQVIMKPNKVTVLNSAYKGKKFIFKWKKVKSSGYIIKYSTDKKLVKNVKKIVIDGSKNTTKKVKLSKKKQYYFKVRAFYNYKGTAVYSDWSEKRTTQYNNVYSSYSTYFDSPEGRTTNIKQACKYIDGTILEPGEIFSFNGVVGQRTAARGFKEATVYSGQEVTTGLGGGVCQVSTTIFNAALLGNLKIVERSQHSMKVHYVDSGRDAAISWGSQDFKFKNDTTHTIKISAKVINNSKIEIKLLTNSIAKHKKVSLSVSNSGKTYVLRRTVDKTVNYTTTSVY